MESAIVRSIFELYRDGNGVKFIASILNHKDLQCRKAKRFTRGRVHQILTKMAYAARHLF